MKMIIRIDENKVVKEEKWKLDDIYKTIDFVFEGLKLRCAKDKSNLLTCYGRKDEKDFARFGKVVNILKREDWFLENLSEWKLYENDDTEGLSVEDLMSRYQTIG